jgi:CRP/FNR family transcriptional regulator, cyclic AMP receptor protein
METLVIPEELLEMAQTYRMLTELDPQQLRKLVPIAEHRQYYTDHVIFHIGDQSSFFHLIVSGDVALEQVAAGKPVHLQTLHHGDAMGWSALTEEARAHFQARALSPVSTIAFPGERLRKACERDPAMGYRLMKRLLEVVTERLDATRARLVSRN